MEAKLIREVVEAAVSAGKDLQSLQTGFVHYHPHLDSDVHPDTIPTEENFLFALALLRTRMGEKMQEAKALVEKLLCYQGKEGEQRGNFPVFLHEFPSCHSRKKAVKILPALYWIQKDFGKILNITTALEHLFRYCLTLVQKFPTDYLLQLRVAAGAIAVGKLLNNNTWVEKGQSMLDEIKKLGPKPCWFSREGIGQILISLQMLKDVEWKEFFTHVSKTWHDDLGVYCGPALEEFQRAYNPEPTIYDLFMNLFSGKSAAVKLLQGALVRPGTLETLEVKNFKGSYLGNYWEMRSCKEFAYSVIGGNETLTKGGRTLMLYWKTCDKLYSLSCEGGNFDVASFAATDRQLDVVFSLPHPIFHDQPYQNRELQFFLNDMQISVEGIQATTFQFEEKILLGDSQRVAMQFILEEGEGDFVGHLMPGNRPSQKEKRALMPAYDRQIFLRTVRKKTACKVRVTIEIHV